MKKTILLPLMILIVLIATANAEDEWIYNAKYLTIDVNVSSSFTVVPESADYTLNYVTARLSFYPRESYRQHIENMVTVPSADEDNGSLVYTWETPTEKDIDFSMKATVKNQNMMPPVTEKIEFPIKDIDEDLKQYTYARDKIDINDDIIELASMLAEGEDDLYIVEHNIANWVKDNVEYSLTTVTEKASQKSSWVLRERYGVCDELTNLFISLNRALGIPARYVYGIAYTNLPEFEDKWGAHGWAEVYFPGYGWIPFDVTYGEFGFIDATHVKMGDSTDSDISTVRYEWLSRNVKIETHDTENKANLVESLGQVGPFVSITARPLKENTGFGSYNAIEVEIENPHSYYVSTEIFISKTNETNLVGDNRKHVILRPQEIKKMYWVIKVSDELDEDYIYTFPVKIYSTRNSSHSTKFVSSIEEPVYSANDIDSILSEKKDVEEKAYSKDVMLSCELEQEEYYEYEEAVANCNVRNLGNTMLNDLEVCLDNKCRDFDLGINQEKVLNFVIGLEKIGKNEFVATAENADVSKVSYLNIDVLEEPVLEVDELSYPSNVKYEQDYEIKFILRKKSNSNPQNVIINILKNGFEKEWSVEEMESDQQFTIELKGNELDSGENKFVLSVKYFDKNNEEYAIDDEEIVVNLVQVNFWQKIKIWFGNVFG